jgi:hypothetical protein
MCAVRADQDPVPLPATGFGGLDEHQHLTLEQVHGEPAEHPLRKEGPVFSKRLDDPLVLERLQCFTPILPAA